MALGDPSGSTAGISLAPFPERGAETVCSVCETESVVTECACCKSKTGVCGACCLLRHAEGRYQLHQPDESSDAFEQCCAMRDLPQEPSKVEPWTEEMVLVGVFDGIGGAMRALELLQISPAVYISIETDSECVNVVSRAWPQAKHLGDLEQITDSQLQEVLQNKKLSRGLITGGFPCQPFSGLNPGRASFEDPRSEMLPLMIELVKRLREVAPHIQWDDMFENVASMVDGDRNEITKSISELPCHQNGELPYRADGADFGHVNRPRYYWLSWDVIDPASGKIAERDRREGYVRVKPPESVLPQLGRP